MLVEGLALDVLHRSSHRCPGCKTHGFSTSHPVFAHHLHTYMASTTSPLAARLLSACSMHWVSDWMLALTLILTITLTWKGGASPWTRVPFFQVLCVRCRAGGQQLSLSRLLQSPLGLGCSPGTLTWPCWAFTMCSKRAVTMGL